MKRFGLLSTYFIIISFCYANAQQNITMYFVPSNPQINTLNPAFQNSCRLFIGLPVISSVHLNFGSDAFSYYDIFKNKGGTNLISPKSLNLWKVNSINTELYTELFTIGFWRKKNYITFSITEKVDEAAFFHRDIVNLVIGGNAPYEGEKAFASRTGIFFDYRREFALGLARKINPETTLGIKGKLLFGKINVSTRKSSSYLYTDPTTFDLTAHSEIKINSSAPITVTTRADGLISSIAYNGTPTGILFNRQNIGLAFDLGFIQKRSESETISGSILDLGAIYYKSTPNNYKISGDYKYVGQLSDTANINNYFDGIVNEAFSEFTATLENKSYLTFLPPRVYLSYENRYSEKTTLNALLTAKIYKYKILPALSIGGSYKLFKNFSLAASWSYNYQSIKNIGFGLVAGRSPMQFYVFTDNVLAFTNPLSVRNFNLRFGINLIFGCKKKKTNINKCGCNWIEESVEKQKRLRKLQKNK